MKQAAGFHADDEDASVSRGAFDTVWCPNCSDQQFASMLFRWCCFGIALNSCPFSGQWNFCTGPSVVYPVRKCGGVVNVWCVVLEVCAHTVPNCFCLSVFPFPFLHFFFNFHMGFSFPSFSSQELKGWQSGGRFASRFLSLGCGSLWPHLPLHVLKQ